MPFKSESQRRLLWMKHPAIARRWAREYPDQKNLPSHVSDKKPKVKKAFEGKQMTTFLENCIDAALASSEVVKKAQAFVQGRETQDKEYQEKVASVIDLAVQLREIDDTPSDREKLAASLTNPVNALDAIAELLGRAKEATAPSLPVTPVDQHGRQVRQKQASYDSTTSPFVGGRRSTEKKASDLAWERGLGIVN